VVALVRHQFLHRLHLVLVLLTHLFKVLRRLAIESAQRQAIPRSESIPSK
jgi:hypothetical protein